MPLNAEKAVALKQVGGNITVNQDPKEGSGCVGKKQVNANPAEPAISAQH